MTNRGDRYEALTEQVLTRLLSQGNNLCVNVLRDQQIAGRSSAHQIDVVFDFHAGILQYRTIAECKDWGKPIDKGKVLEFYAKLIDIPGQPRGIMVSRSGFQEGARDVASHHGIQLYELREARDEDWNGLLRAIEITMVLYAPTFLNVQLEPDIDWLREECGRLNLDRFDIKLNSLTTSKDSFVFGTVSGGVCDLNDVLQKYVPQRECTLPVRHEFTEPVIVPIPNDKIRSIQIAAITADIKVEVIRRIIRVSLEHIVAYCFRDVLRGTSELLTLEADSVPVGKLS